MTADDLERANCLPLPPGWHFTGWLDTVVTLRGPEEIPGNMGRPGVHELFGCNTYGQVDRLLRTYLPARGVLYPYDPQGTLL